jgi:hypothetical protein
LALLPPWITINMGGRWTLLVSNQTILRGSSPPSSALMFTVGSSAGAVVESIYAKPIPPIATSTIAFVHVRPPDATAFILIASTVLPAASSPTPGTDTGQDPIKILLPTETLFPPSITTTPNKGLWLAQGVELYVSLENARSPGWIIYANGGEC